MKKLKGRGPLAYKNTALTAYREYLAKGRRLGYFDDFELPNWMKNE